MNILSVFIVILYIDPWPSCQCTSINKPKKKWKQVGIMKEYRLVPIAVELVGDRKGRVRASMQPEGCSPQWSPIEQPQPRCRRSAAMVKRRTWVNIAVCPCLHSSLTHHRNIKNKVWEIYIFIKKCVSFVIILYYVSAYICICFWLGLWDSTTVIGRVHYSP